MLYAARRVELSGAKTAPPCRVWLLKLAPGIVYGELVALCCAITRREEVSKRRGPERKRLASGETASIEDTPATVRAASTVEAATSKTQTDRVAVCMWTPMMKRPSVDA